MGPREGQRAQGARALRAETRHHGPATCSAASAAYILCSRPEIGRKTKQSKEGEHDGLKSITALQHIFCASQHKNMQAQFPNEPAQTAQSAQIWTQTAQTVQIWTQIAQTAQIWIQTAQTTYTA